MKYFYLFIFLVSVQPFFGQENQSTTNWDEAKKLAEANDKDILVVMTGSQWCSTSRDMRKRVLESDDFKSFTDSNAITYIVDIPTEGCEGDDKEIKEFQKLSDKYQTEAFPALILVNKDGEKIKEIEGKLYKRKNVMEQLNDGSSSSL